MSEGIIFKPTRWAHGHHHVKLKKIHMFKEGDTIRHKVTGQEFYVKGRDHNHYRIALVGDQGDGGLGTIKETEEYFERKTFVRKKMKFNKK